MTSTFPNQFDACSRVALKSAKAAENIWNQISGTALVLKIALTLCVMANLLSADTFGKFTYVDSGSFIEITGYPTTEVGAVEIPETINGKPVTSIRGNSFMDCSGLTSITVPDGVTGIGDAAFSGCSGLISITLPNSLTFIGNSVFRNCSSLSSITLPDSATYIGNFAFSGCQSLTSITIPDGATYIGSFAFSVCQSLTGINIPESVTDIRDYTFSGCQSLTSITIPDSVTGIGDSAFSGCISLTSITIPDSVTSIGGRTFYGCSSLTSIATGNGIYGIPPEAFYGCGSLTSIIIGNSVSLIGNSAFEVCGSLTSITIPDSVTQIDAFAFKNCNNLARILFRGDAPIVGQSVFLYDYQSTVFYLPGTTGWKSSLGTRPTALWAAPVVTNQPASVMANSGENATLSATTSQVTSLPNSYQWQRNGIAIPGATGSSLSLTDIQSANVGNYTVVVTNDAGSVVSAVASLTIAAGELYTQLQYEAALQLGFDLGIQAGSSAVIEDPNSYELYTLTQVQEIHVGPPLLQKDPTTGKFKMTIKAQKSTDLTDFSPFSFNVGEATVNLDGNLEFQFASPDNAAFYRLGVE